MWQYIITGIIVGSAVVYSVYRLIKYFTDPLRKCRECSNECGGCALEDLKRAKDEERGSKY